MKTRLAVLAILIAALLACRELPSRTDALAPAPRVAGDWRGLLSFLPHGDDAELVNPVLTQTGPHVVATLSTRSLGDVTIDGDITGRDLTGLATGVSPAGTYRGTVSGTASSRQIELRLSALISSDGASVHEGQSVLQLTR